TAMSTSVLCVSLRRTAYEMGSPTTDIHEAAATSMGDGGRRSPSLGSIPMKAISIVSSPSSRLLLRLTRRPELHKHSGPNTYECGYKSGQRHVQQLFRSNRGFGQHRIGDNGRHDQIRRLPLQREQAVPLGPCLVYHRPKGVEFALQTSALRTVRDESAPQLFDFRRQLFQLFLQEFHGAPVGGEASPGGYQVLVQLQVDRVEHRYVGGSRTRRGIARRHDYPLAVFPKHLWLVGKSALQRLKTRLVSRNCILR